MWKKSWKAVLIAGLVILLAVTGFLLHRSETERAYLQEQIDRSFEAAFWSLSESFDVEIPEDEIPAREAVARQSVRLCWDLYGATSYRENEELGGLFLALENLSIKTGLYRDQQRINDIGICFSHMRHNLSDENGVHAARAGVEALLG